MTRPRLKPLLALLALATAATAWAGQECAEKPAPSPQARERALALGVRVRDQLEASGASAALVARIAMNLAEYGQRYTHMGVAVRDHVRQRWQVLHLFNACGKGESEITAQPLEQFYEVELFDFEALVLTPSYPVQAEVRKAFLNPTTTRALHQPAYNLIAHPFNTRFQNSNGWILETLALALDKTGSVKDRASAQAWLQRAGYEPGQIWVSNLKRAGARMFSAHVSFLDHTQDEFNKQTYQVITVDSIQRFLATQDPGLVPSSVR